MEPKKGTGLNTDAGLFDLGESGRKLIIIKRSSLKKPCYVLPGDVFNLHAKLTDEDSGDVLFDETVAKNVIRAGAIDTVVFYHFVDDLGLKHGTAVAFGEAK